MVYSVLRSDNVIITEETRVSAHHANVPTDHQANILCKAVNQVQESRPRVGVTSHHQTLRSTETHTQEKTAVFKAAIYSTSEHTL